MEHPILDVSYVCHGTRPADTPFHFPGLGPNPPYAYCPWNVESGYRKRPGWARSSTGKPQRLDGWHRREREPLSSPIASDARAIVRMRENVLDRDLRRAMQHTSHLCSEHPAALPPRAGNTTLAKARAGPRELPHQAAGHFGPSP